jgi:hypothetical protein
MSISENGIGPGTMIVGDLTAAPPA